MTDGARSEPNVIRVMLVDDHDMVLESLRRGLDNEPGIAVVATARSGASLSAAVSQHHPDVVVLDYRLPDLDGAEVARRLLETAPSVKILMLSGYGDDTALLSAVDAGCVGYLDKTASIEQLVAGIRRADAGELVLSATDLAAVLAARDRPPVPSLLTPREAEILRLMAEGLVNRAIAEHLSVSVDTVRTHVQHVLSKLEVHSRLEAVADARRRGLLI